MTQPLNLDEIEARNNKAVVVGVAGPQEREILALCRELRTLRAIQVAAGNLESSCSLLLDYIDLALIEASDPGFIEKAQAERRGGREAIAAYRAALAKDPANAR